MKNALTFITLLNSFFLMNCFTQADLDELDLNQPKYFCGSNLNQAIRHFCPKFKEISQRAKKSFDSENDLKVERALEPLFGSFNEEEDFQGDAGDYGFDLVANYVQFPHLNKRSSLHRERVTITQICCKKPCTVAVLAQYCPWQQ